jgi:assimilatory nitrate reductase catalytic subunit
MFEAAARGEVKALWIACTNPAQSLPDQATVRRALAQAEFVVVQEAFGTTATCDFADLLLPATTWGEKDGTVTNSERRISRVRTAVPAPGEARHDWAIFTDLGRRLEARMPERVARYRPGTTTLFPHTTPEGVWNEHRESTRGRDLDITGLSYAMLETAGPQQWPLPEGASQGQARLYADGQFPTANGRARFAPVEFITTQEPADDAYPFSLNTGRLRDQWHGMSRTGTLGRLFGHVSEPTVDMHPEDMACLGMAEGDVVRVRSRRGQVLIAASGSAAQAKGQAHIAMHWGSEFLGGREPQQPGGMQGVNALTQPQFCTTSKQPELKHAAVVIERVILPWQLVAMAWLPSDRALAVREAVASVARGLAFFSCVPFGNEGRGGHDQQVGVLLRLGNDAAPSVGVLDQLEPWLGLQGAQVMRYQDPARHQHRAVSLRVQEDAKAGAPADGQRIQAFLLAGDVRSEAWLRPLLLEGAPVDALGPRLLYPGTQAPGMVASRGKQICTCFDVSQSQIEAVLSRCTGVEDQRLAQMKGELRCGTHCGSCVPALRKLIRATPAALAAYVQPLVEA